MWCNRFIVLAVDRFGLGFVIEICIDNLIDWLLNDLHISPVDSDRIVMIIHLLYKERKSDISVVSDMFVFTLNIKQFFHNLQLEFFSNEFKDIY